MTGAGTAARRSRGTATTWTTTPTTWRSSSSTSICAASRSSAQVPAAPAPARKSDPWQPVRVLLGKWEGDAQGEPGSGRSEREYRLTLNDRFIRVDGKSTYPPQPKNPKGEVHQDVGFISYDKAAQKLVFRQFHGEGFVNHYVLDSISEDGRTLVFVTVGIENIPAGWRARDTYRQVSATEFVKIFERVHAESF
jgi:hypothetical protein